MTAKSAFSHSKIKIQQIRFIKFKHALNEPKNVTNYLIIIIWSIAFKLNYFLIQLIAIQKLFPNADLIFFSDTNELLDFFFIVMIDFNSELTWFYIRHFSGLKGKFSFAETPCWARKYLLPRISTIYWGISYWKQPIDKFLFFWEDIRNFTICITLNILSWKESSLFYISFQLDSFFLKPFGLKSIVVI